MSWLVNIIDFKQFLLPVKTRKEQMGGGGQAGLYLNLF